MKTDILTLATSLVLVTTCVAGLLGYGVAAGIVFAAVTGTFCGIGLGVLVTRGVVRVLDALTRPVGECGTND